MSKAAIVIALGVLAAWALFMVVVPKEFRDIIVYMVAGYAVGLGGLALGKKLADKE